MYKNQKKGNDIVVNFKIDLVLTVYVLIPVKLTNSAINNKGKFTNNKCLRSHLPPTSV